MHKLLIVDDESWVRERLKCTIDWNKIGLEVVGEAEDGEEALELTEKLSPDIVITDIRMPCIDGIDYIKRLRDNKNATRVILISGYSDFDYAKKAIKLGAFDYILKPIEDDELISVIERCLEEIRQDESKDVLFKRVTEQVIESKAILKEKFFVNLINGYFNTEEEVFKELIKFGISNYECSNMCFILELDEGAAIKGDKLVDKNTIHPIINNIIQENLNKLDNSEFFLLHAGEFICLVFSKMDENNLTNKILSIAKDIKTKVKHTTTSSVTIGIGGVYDTLINIAASYKEAKEALQYKGYIGNDRIYDIGSINTKHKVNYHKFRDIDILLNNIKLGNKEGALESLSNMFKETKKYGDIYPIDLKFLYIDIVNSVFRTILNSKASTEDFSDFSFRFFKEMYFLQTVNETYQWLTDTIIKIIEALQNYKNIKKRKIIETALVYINDHYTEQITLNNVADKLFMNASYFCKIFREEVGEPFTQYFINLRIQKAKEYLTDPTLKIYEIAGKVGYTDIQYFTKIFKSIQGVTPMQYREKIK